MRILIVLLMVAVASLIGAVSRMNTQFAPLRISIECGRARLLPSKTTRMTRPSPTFCLLPRCFIRGRMKEGVQKGWWQCVEPTAMRASQAPPPLPSPM
jgi:hypothetical protein